MTLAAGATLDRYRLVEPMGEGGQGSVWKIVDPLQPGLLRALKVVRLDRARPSDIERMRREAHALARLSHPSLVKCHGLFEDLREHVLGLVLDLVDGRSLGDIIADPNLTPEHKSAALRHIAGALAYLHAQGIVHRDLKMANVLVAREFWSSPHDPSTIKLVDFGIAVDAGNPRPLTEVGSVIGTLSYMPPEVIEPSVWQGPVAAPVGDVFAFGVLGWRVFTRTHPTGLSTSASIREFGAAYRDAATRGPNWPLGDVPEPWRTVLTACLSLRSHERPATALQILRLLGQPSGASQPIADPTTVAARPERTEPARGPAPAPVPPRDPTIPNAPYYASMPPSLPPGYPPIPPAPSYPGPQAPVPSARPSVLGIAFGTFGLTLAAVLGGFLIFRAPASPGAAPVATVGPVGATPTASVSIAPIAPVDLRPATPTGSCCGGLDCSPMAARDFDRLAPMNGLCDHGTQSCKCPSGSSRVPFACADAIPDQRWNLRLAQLTLRDGSTNGRILDDLRKRAGAQLWVRLNNRNEWHRARPFARDLEPVRFDPELTLTTSELIDVGLEVLLKNGADLESAAFGETPLRPRPPIHATALCVGLSYGFHVSRGNDVVQFAFYLDDAQTLAR